jgi:hypothetical protein
MRQPPFKCLFCGTTKGPFESVEHPIPESMGNDEAFLPKGFVCDSCNQYFGSKVEQPIMASPPFNIERVRSSVRTKKHGYAKYQDTSLTLLSNGFWDHMLFAMTPDRYDSVFRKNSGIIWVEPPANFIILLARFLIKIGLETLVQNSDLDMYSNVFDKARRCARFGEGAISWEVAYGQYPKVEDLIKSTRIDEIGLLETRQLYQCEMGCMANGDYQICFIYCTHCYACNLSGPSMQEYVRQFNLINDFKMTIGSGLMIK